MEQVFEVNQQVSFKKLKGGQTITGKVYSFIMDRKKKIPYAVVKDEGGVKYQVQLKKLSIVQP